MTTVRDANIFTWRIANTDAKVEIIELDRTSNLPPGYHKVYCGSIPDKALQNFNGKIYRYVGATNRIATFYLVENKTVV